MTVETVAHAPEIKLSPPASAGAYGKAASMNHGIETSREAKDITEGMLREMGIKSIDPRAANATGVPKEEQMDNAWFRRIGITTTDPIEMKRIWSPRFAHHYETRKWGETYQGRLMMRSVSRFFVGTAFYAAAQLIGDRAFEPGKYIGEKPKNISNPLHWAAFAVDNTVGEGIKFVVKLLGGNEEAARRAVTFRDTVHYGYKNKHGEAITGRSLGQDAVVVTFDFAAMSFGDFMTRYLIGLFDKNAKTKWVKEGHLDLPGGLKEVGEQIFKAVTYAAGEDMAVAIPYCYYMRFQRNLLDKISPGFKYDSDRARLGGSVKMKDGKPVGNYEIEGMLDLTGRFSVYNTMTKMFRDAYAWGQEKLHDFKTGEKLRPEAKEPLTFTGAIKKSAMYVAVTTTKYMFLMVPSAFLFGLLRAPTGKPRGLLIDIDEKGQASFSGKEVSSLIETEKNLPSALNMPNAFTNGIYERAGTEAPSYNAITNPIGKLNYNLGKAYNSVLQGFSSATGFKHEKITNGQFARVWADASIPYTPYFMAKSDLFAPFLDTNRSNLALTNFFNAVGSAATSLVSFKGDKIRTSAVEVKDKWHDLMLAMLKQPFQVPEREAEAQRAMNDEGYKASIEGYDIFQGRQHYRLSDTQEPSLEERRFLRTIFNQQRPSYTEMHGQKPAFDPSALRNRVVVDDPESNRILRPKSETIAPTSLLDRANTPETANASAR